MPRALPALVAPPVGVSDEPKAGTIAQPPRRLHPLAQRGMAEPNYGGAYVNKVSQDEIDAVYEKAAMKASDHHPAPGSYVPSMPDILKAAAKEAEPEEEARFGGAC